MEEKRRIRKIMESTNCTYDQAKNADRDSKGNVEEAIQLVNKKGNEYYVGGGSSGLAVDSGPKQDVITGYSNGLLVNNKFYDYSDPNNLRLKEMLANNEFDRDILGHSEADEKVEVIYKDFTNQEYKDQKEKEIKKNYDNNKKHTLNFNDNLEIDCPDDLILDEPGDIIFKVMIGNKRVTVKMNKNMNVNDFYEKMKIFQIKN
ncbi:hypothetical protein NBO_362g0007 [Nosema bombycis CQ1]|uniref:Uncharacterized protein n=1 Tax=Nosema bombycis (strain CQ1 / CVCC 102059) TaxID=578461 RepID=R0KRI5_NOSB1|nr:hypothetical protein NBO_362g0007 [Nosema bombycis CQ1]|eukprot:EOB12822.1 hypothetical protein NBO_362g0007 [Nosema bombycis CQ1]